MTRLRQAGSHRADSPRPSVRPATFGTIAIVYVAVGALAATGGARPTGIGTVDAGILAAGAIAASACALRARTIPVYVAAGTAAALQPAIVPLLIGVLALAAAFSLRFRDIRRYTRRRDVLAAASAGLAWAAMVGAPSERVANWWFVPMAAMVWLATSARRHGGTDFRRRWTYVTAVTVGATVVFAGLGAVALVMARPDVTRAADRLDDGLAAARAGDTDAARTELRSGAADLAQGEDSLGAFWAKPALLVPGVSQHVRSLHTTVQAARDVADVASATAEDVDLERLGASNGRLDPVAIAAVEEPLARVVAALERARSDVGGLDDTWLVPMVRDEIDDVADRLADASASAQLAHDGVSVVPDLIGLNGPRTYLVLFTTPVEARAHTGFPGNYAEITFEGGRFDMTEFGRIRDLNLSLPDGGVELDIDDEYLSRYERFGVERIWQNITMSPDFPTVAEVAAQLRVAGGRSRPDGVLSVDPTALAALLEFTGPATVPESGIRLTARNAEEYLLTEQYLTFDTDNPERVDVLEFLAEDAFAKLETADLPGPRGLRRALGPAVAEGDLQFFAFAPDAAPFLDQVGISGRFDPGSGDFMAVTTTNAAGNKIDLFMKRSLSYDVTWNPDTGEVEATATITLTNKAPASGLPPSLIGNALGDRPRDIELPEGSNYTFLTVYSPWDATGGTIDGETAGFERLPELGVNAYSVFVALEPGASKTVTIDLSGQVDGSGYDLRILGQPQVQPEAVEVTVRASGDPNLDVRSPLDEASSEPGRYRGSADVEAPVEIHVEVAGE